MSCEPSCFLVSFTSLSSLSRDKDKIKLRPEQSPSERGRETTFHSDNDQPYSILQETGRRLHRQWHCKGNQSPVHFGTTVVKASHILGDRKLVFLPALDDGD